MSIILGNLSNLFVFENNSFDYKKKKKKNSKKIKNAKSLLFFYIMKCF